MSSSLVFAGLLTLFSAPGDAPKVRETAPVSHFKLSNELGLYSGFAFAESASGTRTLLVPSLQAQFLLSPRVALRLDWTMASLFRSEVYCRKARGQIYARPNGAGVCPAPPGQPASAGGPDPDSDDILRMGNPVAGVHYHLLQGATDLILGVSVALPMASVPQPTPEGGPDFYRAPHGEEALRRAMAADGFRKPWRFLWDTASLVIPVEGQLYLSEHLSLQGELNLALLVGVGRLRDGVDGLATLAVGAVSPWSWGELGARLQTGILFEAGGEGLSGALAIHGKYLFGDTLFFRGELVSNLGTPVSARTQDAYAPATMGTPLVTGALNDEALWSLSVGLGARF